MSQELPLLIQNHSRRKPFVPRQARKTIQIQTEESKTKSASAVDMESLKEINEFFRKANEFIALTLKFKDTITSNHMQ
jgi:hypothetical protein